MIQLKITRISTFVEGIVEAEVIGIDDKVVEEVGQIHKTLISSTTRD